MKKMNLVKTSLTLALACAMVVANFAPVSAVVDETQTVTENTEASCDVYYSQESSFTVTIPKKVTLDTTKTSDYEVTVTGDISSDEQVSVVPDADFLMKDQSAASTKKADVTATVTQAKTVWTSAEICVVEGEGDEAVVVGTSETGNISALDLTAGSWAGNFNFTIALEAVPADEVQEPTEG